MADDILTARARQLLAEWYKPIPPHRIVTNTTPWTPREQAQHWAELRHEVAVIDAEHQRRRR